MRCMSCQLPTEGKDASLWLDRVFLCRSCEELADAAKVRIDQQHALNVARAMRRLEQRVLVGGLLARRRSDE